MNGDYETAGGNEMARAATATNTPVSGAKILRTTKIMRIARGNRSSIRVARQKMIHKKIWASAAAVMSRKDSPPVASNVASNVARTPRPPDARYRPVLSACPTNSFSHNLERQPMAHARSKDGEGKVTNSAALTESCSMEAAPAPVAFRVQGEEGERVPMLSHLVSSDTMSPSRGDSGPESSTGVNDTSSARGDSNGLLGVDLGHSPATTTATPLDFTPPAEGVHVPDVVDASVRSVEGEINFVQTASPINSPHKSGWSWCGQLKNTEALAHESQRRKSDALDSFSTMWLVAKGEHGEEVVSAERMTTAGKGATPLSNASTFTGGPEGFAQRTDEGNQVRFAPTCLKSRYSQNKTIRMSRDRETTDENDTTRAASATNTAVSGVEKVRTNSSRRMARFSRRSIRAARQKKVHETMWASAGDLMSQMESTTVTSNVARIPRPPDARYRSVLHACPTRSGSHNLERQSMLHVTSQGGDWEGISSAALTQTCCEEAASVPIGLQPECLSTTSQMISSEKDAHDPFEVGVPVPMTTPEHSSLSTVKQDRNDERDTCVGFDPVDDDARECPVGGCHLPECLPLGLLVVKNTEIMSSFLQRASVQELTTAVSATRSTGSDSNGLPSGSLGCSPANATATPLDHTPAAEFVRGTGPWDVADAPVRSVDGETNRTQTEVSNTGKSDPTWSDQLKNTEAPARESQHRESDALDIFSSVYLVTKGEQCEGVVATRNEATDKNSGELSVTKVEAVDGLVLPEPLTAVGLSSSTAMEATLLDDQGDTQCAFETASSTSDKAVAVDRRAPVSLAPSSKDGLCGSGAKGIKRPAYPGSSDHQDNDPTKQLPTSRRSLRLRSMAATQRRVLTKGSASVCADFSEFRCENVAKDACSKPTVSSGVRHQPVSHTIRQSDVLPPASSGDVPEQGTVLAEEGSVGSRHETKRNDSLSTACCTSESLRIEVFKKPAVRRSTRRRSMGVVSKGESVFLPLRARGIQCAETCAPPKAVARAESREKTVGSMESAVGCNPMEDRMARQEYGSTQGALVRADNAGGTAPQSSSRRSACHLYAKSDAPDSHSSETTRGIENCSPRTSSILEADNLGKGGHCGVIADVVQEDVACPRAFRLSYMVSRVEVTFLPSTAHSGHQIQRSQRSPTKCMSRVEGVGVEASTGLDGKIEPLPSLLAAIEAAEACCIKHERLSSPGTEKLHTTKATKRVRFCAFDLSAVDMPRDSTLGSQIPAEDVARCLNRVVEAQSVVREAIRARSSGYKEWGATWGAFLRELRTLTIRGEPEIIVAGRGYERLRGNEETTKHSEMQRREAARFLLAELEPLETSEGPVYTALGEKLGNFLVSLVRFKLRTLFNPPPEKLSKADNDVTDKTRFSGKSAGVAGPSHFSKVHEMVDLGQGQPNATLAKALRRLYGYPGESAVESVAVAEGFLAEATYRRWTFDTATLAEEARRHLIAIADIVDAVRARRFLRSLLELDVVRVAITAAGAWSHVETLASNLKKVMDSANIHTPLTLLSDIEGLQRWLGNDDLWPFRAEEVLQQMLAFLAPVTENPRKRWRTANGAVELLREAALEAKHRLLFPAVKVVKGVKETMTEKGRSWNADGDRSTKSKPGNTSRSARRVEDNVMDHVDHDREKRGASGARLPRPTSSKKQKRHRRESIM